MEEVSIIGLDLTKNIFQLHGARPDDRWASGEHCHAESSCRSLRQYRAVGSRWKLAQARTIGLGKSARSDTKCDLSRQSM